MFFSSSTKPISALALAGTIACALAIEACGASRFGALYPPRPTGAPASPIADPAPSKVTAHVRMTSAALREALHTAVPASGEGTFRALGGDRKYTWTRQSPDVSFAQGRIAVDLHVNVAVVAPVAPLRFALDVRVFAEPIINGSYAMRLQSVESKVTSRDTTLRLAEAFGGALGAIGVEIENQMKAFSYDLKPMMQGLYDKLKTPYEFDVGDAKGCAELRVLGVEAGPTVLADGLEKDIAFVISPSVTLPCTRAAENDPLPPLSNVTHVTSGPFVITVPVAARYDELTRAMTMTFTDGKYFFSAEYPKLYLSEPEIYAADDRLVLKVRIRGPIKKLGIEEDLDGELFLSGKPQVLDNELSIPDLEPTIETRSFFLKLKAATDSDHIRDDARRALRLNLTERFSAVRDQVAQSLEVGTDQGCVRGAVDRFEITAVYPHSSYLRVVLAVTARARIDIPCGAR